ncbi:TetR/AcrR family transcriptional regulator [Caulobacter mirabilis]|uniref:TetR family transcriptional regulator n=1 Tax=Caulobacter mirabilis TaxID=69666 RepID=A0A2D2AUV2_9CAUL|nr:TetR/AcrR family transcriptional regulator [Caulobacter mirabilis]ATQ41771.1 TetR family transcriptional regulator [Caulobacter mirabilis]
MGKLSKAERRAQLLATALEIARTKGANALTLGHLAERAGVSRPVAYQHFETRAGLLMQLYRDIADRQHQTLRETLAKADAGFGASARAAGQATIRCYATVGPEAFAIAVALQGDPALEAFQRELIDRYVETYVVAFRPLVDLDDAELRLRCIAVVGAGDALAGRMLDGSLPEAEAAGLLTSLILSWLPSRRPS